MVDVILLISGRLRVVDAKNVCWQYHDLCLLVMSVNLWAVHIEKRVG